MTDHEPSEIEKAYAHLRSPAAARGSTCCETAFNVLIAAARAYEAEKAKRERAEALVAQLLEGAKARRCSRCFAYMAVDDAEAGKPEEEGDE